MSQVLGNWWVAMRLQLYVHPPHGLHGDGLKYSGFLSWGYAEATAKERGGVLIQSVRAFSQSGWIIDVSWKEIKKEKQLEKWTQQEVWRMLRRAVVTWGAIPSRLDTTQRCQTSTYGVIFLYRAKHVYFAFTSLCAFVRVRGRNNNICVSWSMTS